MDHSTFSSILRFTVLFAILSQVSLVQGKGLGKCVDDSTCGPGFYCSSNVCEICVPCENVFNRQSLMYSSGEPVCAKSVSNCGQCLKGFQPFDRSDGQPSEKCFPWGKSISYSNTSVLAAPAAWVMFFLCSLSWIIY
ncbi:hypothetical protein DAPPUDRAFT_318355 [Daphnia pulex]|uniref:TNFR-Cys domain-containing protein n=1 Tax=Daphnia pulex TaxID=6669 RepID=E9GIJ9_DAPPU|nr:hypothetical protein DAPPUDRAFT_318355 [Daphnia pulex]|eukprot:EFX80674.1 hypothetical protein DAPPUDRAFT_318355 [Daphnia pulex]